MNPISELNEKCQALYLHLPRFVGPVRSQSAPGEDHTPCFDCTIILPDKESSTYEITAHRGSKRDTKTELARRVLKAVKAERETANQSTSRFSRPESGAAAKKPSPPSEESSWRIAGNKRNKNLAPRDPGKAKEPISPRRTILVETCRVVTCHPNSVEAKCQSKSGTVRLSGDFAKNVQSGMAVEIRVVQNVGK